MMTLFERRNVIEVGINCNGLFSIITLKKDNFYEYFGVIFMILSCFHKFLTDFNLFITCIFHKTDGFMFFGYFQMAVESNPCKFKGPESFFIRMYDFKGYDFSFTSK